MNSKITDILNGICKNKIAAAEYFFQFLPILLMGLIQLFSEKPYGIHDYIENFLLIIIVDLSAQTTAVIRKMFAYSLCAPVLLVLSCVMYALLEVNTMRNFGLIRSIIVDIVAITVIVLSIALKINVIRSGSQI